MLLESNSVTFQVFVSCNDMHKIQLVDTMSSWVFGLLGKWCLGLVHANGRQYGGLSG